MGLSVVIITLNAARTLEKTLQSLPKGAQIVVFDSGSQDATQKICRRYGVEFYQKNWSGFGPQRNAATERCTKPWVLYLDADEWLSHGLSEEIERAVQSSQTNRAYKMRRLSRMDGKFIKHGDWAADYVTRLVPRRKACWIGDEPHPRLDEKNLYIAELKCPLLHDPYADIEDYEKKIRSYARAWAMNQHNKGKSVPKSVAFLRAFWRWFRCFVLRAGFLDGKQGWLIASMSAKMVIYKHRELQQLSTDTHS